MYHYSCATLLRVSCPKTEVEIQSLATGALFILFYFFHCPLFCREVYGKSRRNFLKVLYFAWTFGFEVRTKYKFFSIKLRQNTKKVRTKYKKSSGKLQISSGKIQIFEVRAKYKSKKKLGQNTNWFWKFGQNTKYPFDITWKSYECVEKRLVRDVKTCSKRKYRFTVKVKISAISARCCQEHVVGGTHLKFI